MSDRGRRVAALLVVFAGVAGLYAATFSFRAITDTRVNSLQTRALVEHGDIDLSRYAEAEGYVRPDLVARQVVRQEDGALYSIYGVGVSAAAAPIYAALVRLDASEAFLQGAVGVLYAAGAVVVLYHTMLTLTPRAVAAGTAAVFAFGTTMWTVASMAFFPQAPMIFFESVGLAGFLSRRTWAPALAGFGFGAATFIRPTAAIPLILVGGFYLVRDRRALAAYVLGAIPLTAVAVHNQIFWGALSGGYGEARVGFHAPWPQTLGRILFGWWRGIFTYSPALLLGFAGIVVAARRARGFVEQRLLVLGVSAAATILFTSFWTQWHGGVNQFGYRLLLEVVPFLVVLGAYAVARADRLRPVAVMLGVLSILTMTWGAAPSPNGWDGKLFATEIADTSLGQSWIHFLDHPLEGLLRLAGVAAVTALLFLVARRYWEPQEPAVVA